MRPLIRLFSLVCLAPLAAIAAQAEPGILWVKVLNLKNRPIPRISVGAEAPGSSDITDDHGLAKIKLAPQTRPEDWLTLKVSGGDYEFISPWDRKAPMPSSGNGLENPFYVYLTDRGDREALKNIRFIVAAAAKCNARLEARITDKRTTEEERSAALAEVARSFGLKPDEVDYAIRELGKKTVDPYEKGVIALYEQNYPDAEMYLSRSYELRRAARKKAEAELEKARAEERDAAFFSGQALYQEGKYREAAEILREADTLQNDDVNILNYWGSALYQAGRYVEAEACLKRALVLREKSPGPDHPDTATSLDNLALLYVAQGKYAEAE